MPIRNSIFLVAALALFFGAIAPAEEAAPISPAVYHRTVFLGDSITDGDTYPKFVRDALAHAGLPKMVAINAGIGGDTAKGMHARLERDVLAFHPTLVTLSAGANDAGHNVSGEAYEEDVKAIIQRLKQEKIPLIILTPCMLGPKVEPRGQKNLDIYEAILRRLAHENGLRVAEVNVRQKEGAALGRPMLAADDVHPNWDGQKMIARAVLDAMGYPKAAVPDEISADLQPGVVSHWMMNRLEPKSPPLTEAAVAEINPGPTWIALTLPETEPMAKIDADNHWYEGYRFQGASVALLQQPPGKYIGYATIDSPAAQTMQFHTGAELNQIWLNGKKIYQNGPRRGYHIGRESVPGELKQGKNVIVIETGRAFFLSVTEGDMWEEK